MNPLTFISETPLAGTNCNKCKSLAFDGKYFYASSPMSYKIFIYNKNFKLVDCLKTNKGYDSICYDNINKCFWASCNKFYSRVFKLNMDLVEIDSLPLPLCSSVVCDLSCNCSENTLLVAYTDAVIEISIVNSCNYVMRQQKSNLFYLSVLSISPFYMSAYLKNCLQYIGLYTNNNTELSLINTANQYTVDSMVFVPDAIASYVYILCTKNGCYPYILKYSLSLNDIYSCNYNFTSQNLNNAGMSHLNAATPEADNIISTDALNNNSEMVKSLLSMQENLSNILKSQSTKIMNLLEYNASMDDILLVNKSVNDTIINILNAENIIHANLKLLLNDK